MKFGEFLTTENLVSTDAVKEALAVQGVSKGKIGRILVDLGLLSQETCNTALEKFLRVSQDESILQKIASDPALTIEAVESANTKGFLLSGELPILLLAGFRDDLVREVERRVSKFEVRLISGEQASVLSSLKSRQNKQENILSAPQLQKETPPAILRRDSDPYQELFLSLLKAAKENNASDIHFDTTREGISVRFRINGDLHEQKRLPMNHTQSIMTEVKRQTGLPLTVVGSPSGGSARFDALKLKVRAQSNGQILGESVVLRLIDEDKTRFASLDAVGSDEMFLADMKRAIQFSNGLILLCGQTGSGKSWTLYSVLMSLDRVTQKIITIEDPVEYEGDGLMQIEVKEKRITFSDALRSCLRLDPDVIMVGEIRDEETAGLAFKAASTGHLVFSTLHTNGAIEALVRLKGLGVADDLIRSNIRLISALTLKKRLCSHCRIEVSSDEGLSDELKALRAMDVRLFRRNSEGCEQCFQGVTGRILLCESVNQEMVERALENKIVPGYRSLSQCAVEYAAHGIIGVEDAVSL